MNLVDANLLVYAHVRTFQQLDSARLARLTIQRCLTGRFAVA